MKRINELIKNCMRSPFEGIGKPEALKGDLQGYWSRQLLQNIGWFINMKMIIY